MEEAQFLRDLLILGRQQAFDKHKIPVEQAWPPAWLEYEQPGASVYNFTANTPIRGFFSQKNDPNNLYINQYPQKTPRAYEEVLRHEAQHRQQHQAAQRDDSHWTRYYRETPKDLQEIIERHTDTAGNDTATYSEALATIAGMQHRLKGTPNLEWLMNSLRSNKNWNEQYQYDYNPLFNIRDSNGTVKNDR